MRIRMKLAKYLGASVATAAVIGGCIAAACILPSTNTNTSDATSTTKNGTAVTNDDYIYEPIELEYESFNVPIVLADYRKENYTSNLNYSTVATVDQAGCYLSDVKKWGGSALDAGCSWWVDSALPTSGSSAYNTYVYAYDNTTRAPFVVNNNKITIVDKNNDKISWVMPFSEEAGKLNNCVKVDNTHQTQTIKFSKYNSYSNLYLLATAANTPASTASITCTVRYSTGDPATANFTVLDWFSSTTPPTDVSVATQAYTRFQIDTNGNHYGKTYFSDYDYRYPKLYRCNINGLDTNRLVKEIDITDTSGNTMVTTIYGVCGAYNNQLTIPQPTATNIKTSTATIEWPTVTGAQKYYLDVFHYVETENGSSIVDDYDNVEIDGSATSYDLTGLDAGQKYYYRMRASDASGPTKSSSDDANFTTNDTMTILDPEDVTSAGFTARWEPLPSGSRTDVAKYVLSISDSSTFTSSETTDITDLDTSSLIISKYNNNPLIEGKSYFYRIKYVYNDSTESDWSSSAEAEIPINASSITLTPTTINLLTGGTSTITSSVLGSDGTTPATNQNINWSGTGLNSIVKVETDASNPGKHTVTALRPGTITLTATSAQTSTVTATCTVNVKPNKPTLNELTNATYKSFDAQFVEPSEANTVTSGTYSYVFEYSDGSTTRTDTATHSSISPQTKSITTNVAPKTTYSVRVKTVYTDVDSNVYESDYTDAQNITTTAIPAHTISLSSAQTINVSTSKDITATIYGPEGGSQLASSQEVVWSSNVSNWQEYLTITKKSGSETQYTVKANKAYSGKKITLTATAKDYATVSASIDITINLPAPTITAQAISAETINVSWATVTGATSYELEYGIGGQYVSIPSISGKQYIIDGLDPVTEYEMHVYSVNNGVKTMSNHVKVTTLAQEATGLTINPTSASVLLGEVLPVTSKVEGTTSHEATNQTVTGKASESGTAQVTLWDNEKNHTITATTQGITSVTYTDASNKYSATCYIYVKDAEATNPSDVSTYSFIANWKDVGAQSYYIDVAEDLEFNKILTNYNNKKVTGSTSLSVTGLKPRSQYYYRVRYENNSLISTSSNIVNTMTTSDVSGLSLNKNTLRVKVGQPDQSLVATVNTTDASGKKVVWSISDESVAKIEEVQLNDNQSTLKISGLKDGTATISASIENYSEIPTVQCTLAVFNDLIDAPNLNIKDITTHGFTASWNQVEPTGVTYTLKVWKINAEKKVEDIVVKSTKNLEAKIDTEDYPKIVAGGTYYVTVTVKRDGTGVSATSEEKTVTLLSPPITIPKEIIIASAGGAVGFWLLLSYILYIFWKKSILKTYDQKKAKDKARGKKVKTHDKYFRAIDKACVGFNKAVSKRSNSLMTRLGTKNEQKYLKKK